MWAVVLTMYGVLNFKSLLGAKWLPLLFGATSVGCRNVQKFLLLQVQTKKRKCIQVKKKSVFANYNALNAFEEMNQCHFCLPLSTAFLVSVAILPCLVEPKYINTIIRGAVGGAVSSVLLSNKQRPGGITCHDSYMTGSCYHTPSAEVWKPWSFCCDHLFFKLLLTIWLSVKFIYLKMLITVICNHFIFRFSNVQQSPVGGLRIY